TPRAPPRHASGDRGLVGTGAGGAVLRRRFGLVAGGLAARGAAGQRLFARPRARGGCLGTGTAGATRDRPGGVLTHHAAIVGAGSRRGGAGAHGLAVDP